MNSKTFLEYVDQSIDEQTDFFLIRLMGYSSEIQINANKFTLDELELLLSYFQGNSSVGEIRNWIENFRSSGKSCSISEFVDHRGVSSKLVIERINKKSSIFIFGAGHVGQALALISVLLGYDVVVVDDRSEFACRKRLPDPRIKLVVDDFGSAIRNLNIGSRSAIVIVTRGHQFDEVCLQGLLRLKTNYLGMIGSKRRVMSILKRLKEQGFADNDLKKVHAPIGLSIGATSPQEIAVAILAEIIAESNKVFNH